MPFPAACCLRDWEALSNTGASATQRSRFFSERASGSSAASNTKTGMVLRPSRSEANPPEFRSSRAPFIPVTGFPSPCASLSPLVPPLGPAGRWGTGALSAQPRRDFLPAHSFFFPPIFFPGVRSPHPAKLRLAGTAGDEEGRAPARRDPAGGRWRTALLLQLSRAVIKAVCSGED